MQVAQVMKMRFDVYSAASGSALETHWKLFELFLNAARSHGRGWSATPLHDLGRSLFHQIMASYGAIRHKVSRAEYEAKMAELVKPEDTEDPEFTACQKLWAAHSSRTTAKRSSSARSSSGQRKPASRSSSGSKLTGAKSASVAKPSAATTMTCHNCGGLGHKASACPSKAKSGGSAAGNDKGAGPKRPPAQ
jgi:cobalamin biosynthesis Mg chelatase CobN